MVLQVEELMWEKRWQAVDASKSLAVPLGVRGKDDAAYHESCPWSTRD